MPCDQVRTTTLDIGKCDRTLLAAAMQELGYSSWVYNEQARTIRINGADARDAQVNKIQQTYSTQVVKSQAKRFGWKLLKQEGNQLIYEKR